MAFSPIDGIWFLIGASPDLRTQIIATKELAPAPDSASPVAGVFLPSAELEDVEGLLQLCDIQNAFVFATPAVQKIVRSDIRVFPSSQRSKASVQWQPLSPRRRIGCHLSDTPGDPPTFFYTPLPLPARSPDSLPGDTPRNSPPEEAHMALLLEQGERKSLIAPRIFGGSSEWFKLAESSDVVLLDAQPWRQLLEQFPRDAKARKILLRLDHESPLLDEQSEERRTVVEAGFEIAYDGMDIKL